MPTGQLGSAFSRSLLTVSIEGGSIRLMVSGGRRIIAWLTVPFNPRMVSDSRIEDPSGLAAVVKSSVARLGVKYGKVVAAFPGSRVTTRVVSLPAVSGVRDSVMLPREARRVLGSAMDFHHVFWAPLGACPIFLGKMASAGVANKGVTG